MKKELEKFLKWIDERKSKGYLAANSADVQKSILRRWFEKVERNGWDLETGVEKIKTRKEDVIGRFISFVKAKELVGKTVDTPFGRGKVEERVVTVGLPQVFVKVRIGDKFYVIPVKAVEEVEDGG